MRQISSLEQVKGIVHSFSTHKIAALPARHALSGADTTGTFAGKGKATWWRAFQDASQDIITALANLGASEPPSAETMAAIEKLISSCLCRTRLLLLPKICNGSWLGPRNFHRLKLP